MPSKKRVGFTDALRRRILDRDDHTCGYCAFPAEQVDHVVPYAYWRDNSESNLVAACRACNSIASDLFFPDFDTKRDYVLSIRRPQILANQ